MLQVPIYYRKVTVPPFDLIVISRHGELYDDLGSTLATFSGALVADNRDIKIRGRIRMVRR